MNDSHLEFSNLRNHLLSHYPELKPDQKFSKQLYYFYFLLGSVLFISLIGVKSSHFSFLYLSSKALLLGFLYASLGLFTHELLHGSIVKISERIRIIANFGFFIFGLSPELWMSWHNRVHHYHTNVSGIDPDSFGLFENFKNYPMTSFILKRSPGSGHFWSYVYLPLNFSNQVLSIMWYVLWKGDQKLFTGVNKKRAICETLIIYGVWILFLILLGFKSFLWILIIPSLIANLIVSSYILVQHLMCPLTSENLPLKTTLGVSTFPFLDFIHFNFGHHVEHHLFPEMNHQTLPILRRIMMKDYPNDYRLMSHRDALILLLSTPRVYENDHTLFDPNQKIPNFDVSKTGINNFN